MSSSQEMSFETVHPFPDDLHVWLEKGKGKSLALGLSLWAASPPRRGCAPAESGSGGALLCASV